MRYFIVLFICFLFSVGLILAENHKLVRIYPVDEQQFQMIKNLDVIKLSVKKISVDAVITAKDEAFLSANKLPFEVIIDNLSDYYVKRYNQSLHEMKKTQEILGSSNFRLGSYGGFYPLDSLYLILQEMKELYPKYFKKSTILDYTIENRPIYAYTIGNSSSSNPEVLLTACHHAREAGGYMALLYYFWNLFEKADAGDTLSRYLLENRSITLVPMVNPDGYAYNELTNPKGGGMWRKNRKKLDDSTFGVDLNRNYGPYYFWNAPNNGSSLKASDITYRGPSPFSEIETAALRDLCYSHKFKTALNYHTYSNLLIYPYSALSVETPDSLFYRSLAEFMTKSNLYYTGTDFFTVGYTTRGGSDDFMYLDTAGKAKIICFTPEIGNLSDGFWPIAPRILEHCAENYSMIDNMIASAEAHIRPFEVLAGSETLSDSLQQSFIYLRFKNIGVAKAQEKSQVIINCNDNGIILDSVSIEIPVLEPNEDFIYKLNVGVQSGFSNGTLVPVSIQTNTKGMIHSDTFNLQFASFRTNTLYKDEKLLGNWDKGAWGDIYDENLKHFVLNDSPKGIYKDSSDNFLTMTDFINITSAPTVLEFSARWVTEANYDAAVVQISSDSGKSWMHLRTDKMITGYGVKDSRLKSGYGFMGYYPTWINQSCSLDKFKNKYIKLRFGMLSDIGKNYDGLFLDDIKIKVFDIQNYSGIKDASERYFSLYPNPVLKGGKLFVELNNHFEQNSAALITISDLNGKECYKMISGSDRIRIATDFMEPGAYFLQIKSGTHSETSEFIVIE